MQKTRAGLVVSASDLVEFLECQHLTNSQLLRTQGAFNRPVRKDLRNDAWSAEGLAHEARYLQRLKDEGLTVTEIPGVRESASDAEVGARMTQEAMARGDDVIYQATFVDYPWTNHADFVVKTPTGYEVVDAKLARHPKPSAVMQIATYSAQVARLQGHEPEQMHILGGDNTLHSLRVADFSALQRASASRYEQWISNPPTTKPEPVEACNWCDFLTMCDTQWRLDDDLSQLSGAARPFRQKLTAAGISTVAALAAADPSLPVEGVTRSMLERQHHQALLQVKKRESGIPQLEFFAPARQGIGFGMMPAPHPMDVQFDLEGSPLARDGGREYLWGVKYLTAGGVPRYRQRWGIHLAKRGPGGLTPQDVAADDVAECRALQEFLDFVAKRHERYPDMHVYHYGDYDVARALRRSVDRYDTHRQLLSDLMREGVFVDRLSIARNSMWTSEGSYSLKAMEAFYPMSRRGLVTDAAMSMVLFQKFLETGDRRILAQLKEYNADDLDSLELFGVLQEQGRTSLIQQGHDIPRPVIEVVTRSEKQLAADAHLMRVRDQLLQGLPATEDQRSADQQASWLLAKMLDWYREEARPEWNDHRRRLHMTEDELHFETGAVAGLQHIEEDPEAVQRSLIHRYRFDPAQEYNIKVGDTVVDPVTDSSAGVVHAIDDVNGILSLKRGRGSSVPHPSAVLQPKPIPTTAQRQALLDLAESMLETGADGPGRYRAARDLLLRRAPAVDGLAEGLSLVARTTSAPDGLRRVMPRLAESCLVVQGPPGTGKTRGAAAKVVVDAVMRGETVAISASAHKIISELVTAACEEAASREMELNIVQRALAEEASTNEMVNVAASNDKVIEALEQGDVNVVAGSAWMLCNERFRAATRERPIDLLVIDEAGKLSLPDALATSTVARNVLLVGDQQQLEQPIQGVHAVGTDVSALEHYVGGSTIEPWRGVLLDTTHRMHPTITRFVSKTFYDGRLRSHRNTSRQLVLPNDALGGSGNRFISLPQVNEPTSEATADVVQRIYESLLGRVWISSDGQERVIGPQDIITTAPRNAQVTAARVALKRWDALTAARVRIGTTDRMQSQEAAVSVLLLGGPADATRSLEFHLSRARLNVAVTRSRALAVVVASPEWMTTTGRTVEQMRCVNALCAFAESAVTLDERLEPAPLELPLQSRTPDSQPLIGTPEPTQLARRISFEFG